MQIFIVREIKLFKVKYIYISLFVLAKQGGGEVLTRIVPFIKPRIHERYHIRNLLS